MKVGQQNVESYVQTLRTLPDGRIQRTTITTSKAPPKDIPNIIRPRTVNGGRVGKRPSLDIYEKYEDLDHEEDPVIIAKKIKAGSYY